MFAIKEGNEYVACSTPHWLNLLNGTSKKSEYATKFRTRKEAEDFKAKLEQDGYDACGSEVFDRFKVVVVRNRR